jgi:polysaccharide biosynthesis transport protein
MDMHNGMGPNPAAGPQAMPGPGGEPQGFDIVRVLWRWKLLPILGSIVGAALGYLYFTRQAPQYIATALVQVVNPIPPSTRMQAFNPDEVIDYSRTDESIVISSERVLKKAADKLKATDSIAFVRDMRPEELVVWILSNKRLTVQPAQKDLKTTLINISFVCEDAALSAAVVNAVVDGYSEYLSEEYRTVGNEVYDLTMKAQANIEKSYKDLRDRNLKFRKEAPLIWTGDGTEDPYAKNLQELNGRISANSVERSMIAAKLKHAQEALSQNRDPAVILTWLTNAELQQSPLQASALDSMKQKLARGPLESKRLEQNDLFRLRMEEQRYLNTVGDGHPRLATVRQQIGLLEQQIARMREAERLEELELQQDMQEQLLKEGEHPAPLTVAERLQVRMQAMAENMAALEVEEQGLRALAADNERRSKELQHFIQENELYQRELASVQLMLDAYRDKLKQIEVLPATAAQRTLKELNLPTNGWFYGPKLAPFLLGGAAVGFLLMAGLAVLLELADKSFRTPDDIVQLIGAPVLGHIPIMDAANMVKKANHVADGSLCTIHHSRGRVSEAFRGVRTSLFFSNRTGELKVIQVTSPVPGDGKSTLSSNLAVTMAQSGRRVLLIDADFRRPRIAKLFGIEADIGMATVVAGAAELDDGIHASCVANLSIMPGGKRPSNPAELLSSPRFGELLEALREKFDMIIVDTPPLLAVSDPSAVAAVVDGVVLAMRLRRNVKPLVARATKILDTVDANVLGIVVNGVTAEAAYGGYSYGYKDYRYGSRYGYGYGYGKYGNRYGYGDANDPGRYLDEPHDIDTDHVLTQPVGESVTGRQKPDGV